LVLLLFVVVVVESRLKRLKPVLNEANCAGIKNESKSS
jgi:hypothetical protein